MTALKREALCAFLDNVAESAKDAGIDLGGVYVWVEPEDWPDACTLFGIADAARRHLNMCVVRDTWQGVHVYAHKKTAQATRAPAMRAVP